MQEKTTTDFRPGIILFISLSLVTGVWFVDPIPQDQEYHRFADQGTLLGIANFWNVISNVPFLFVALYGFRKISGLKSALNHSLHFYLAWVFLAGVFLTGFGSAYYHYSPTNATLVWDRLPLTFAFMAFFSIAIAEYLSLRAAKLLFVPLLIVGVASIFYWDYTERLGNGDLRLYALVQFLPMIVIPLMLVFFPSRSRMTPYLWWTLVFYGLAKLLEHFDKEILGMLKIMGGHPWKHVAAAVAVMFLVKAISVTSSRGVVDEPGR